MSRVTVRSLRPDIKHLYQSRFYGIWANMKRRCYLKSMTYYDYYGGRGIEVCERWHKFENFYDDMYSTYREDLQLDRTDNNGNYEPSNCRWVTPKENSINRRNTHLWEYKGQKYTASDWARKVGINYSTLSMRLWKYGWSIDKALTEPVKGRAVL